MMISATFVLPRMQHGGKLREKDAFDLKVPKRQMFISGSRGGRGGIFGTCQTPTSTELCTWVTAKQQGVEKGRGGRGA